jgi:hypothetical protein
MPNAKGVVETERDRVLLAYVGIARYASADQLHRLFFADASKKQTYRRLAKLCKPGPRPGDGACLRRLQYRRAEGTAVPVWALTPFGRSIAAKAVPYLRPPAASDIGHRFLEHTLLLNDVLVSLVLALRASPAAPLGDLPFRWLSEDDGVLQFEANDRKTLLARRTCVLKPDAIVEVPAQEHRLFIEAETGSQSIVTAHPDRTGAVIAKLQRYWDFFSGHDGEMAIYARAFPKAKLYPRLVFVVHSLERAGRVERAVKKHLGQFHRGFDVRVLTFDNAGAILADFIRPGATVPRPMAPASPPARAPGSAAAPAPGPKPPSPALTLDQTQLKQLRDSFVAVGVTLEEAFEIVAKHEARGACRVGLPRLPGEHLEFLRQLILWGKYLPPRSATAGQPHR